MTNLENFYKNKKVLVTGGTGLIGIPLVKKLLKIGAKVTIVSLDDKALAPQNTKFLKLDLREFTNCMKACKNQDYVFHLAGVKGSPMMTRKKPASFFVPTLTFSLNMMEAARRSKVKKYLLTSSIGVYGPAQIFKEDNTWNQYPSENDKFAGWAKRMCELQAEAYAIEHNWKNVTIVRPANVYGPYDNFGENNAMVIPMLINKANNAKYEFEVWGDGRPVRDLIYSEDVANAMIHLVFKNIRGPINIGTGKGISIKKVANIISENVKNYKLKIKWDKSKPSGDKKRLMNIEKLKASGFKNYTSADDGIKKTIKWFLLNKNKKSKKYNSFEEK